MIVGQYRLRRGVVRDERGFTIVELFVASSIVSILAALALTTFYIYKDEVEYRKAEATMRNARTAMEAGDLEAATGASLGLTFSGTTGGPVSGPLATVLPGAVVSNEVRLGVQYNNCTDTSPPTMVNQMLLSQPCNASKYTSFLKTCNGVEVTQHNLPQGDVC